MIYKIPIILEISEDRALEIQKRQEIKKSAITMAVLGLNSAEEESILKQIAEYCKLNTVEDTQKVLMEATECAI